MSCNAVYMLWHRILVDGCDPKGHPVLFFVVLKDRRAWEGISHAKPRKIVAYLGPLKTANFMPSPRPPRIPTPRPPRVQGADKSNHSPLWVSFAARC